ncbi:MAG: membrane protein insertion efficiency factor YidD [Bacteroidetes bacterium CG2_30_33_31]|nr:MAG: membrane protein insertion efficiency factor YidD [Bacteroidetes bacterium CG2_30_33_31]
MHNNLKKISIEIVLLPVQFYRYAISPLTPASCRHIPTCSEYCVDALKRYGVLQGSAMAAERIARCHPWGTSGYDPVPLFKFRIFKKSKLKSNLLKHRVQD